MKVKLVLVCICLFVWAHTSSGIAQGPAGEVIHRPPPVDEQAAARAQQAARLRRQAAIRDQVELALKTGNAAMDGYFIKPADEQKKTLSKAEAEYLRAAQLQRNDWRAYSGLGSVYFHEGRYVDAEVACKRAIALKANDAYLYKLLAGIYESEYVRLPEAATAERKRKLDEWIPALARAVELDPSEKYDYGYHELAGLYERAKLPDRAIATYKRLLIVLPPSAVGKIADTHQSMARVYEHANRFAEAIDEYKECIRLKPNEADYYFHLGDAYVEAKRYPEAIEAYQQAKRLRSTNDALADIRIGEVYIEAADYDKAVEVLTRATQLEPGNWEPFADLGYAYYSQKQYLKGVGPLQQAVRLRPEVDGSHYYLGLTQLMLGHKSEAMQQYEELKKLKSDYADKLLSEINKQ